MIKNCVLDVYRIIFGPLRIERIRRRSSAPVRVHHAGGGADTTMTLPLCARVLGILIMLAELRVRYLLVWFSFLLYYIGLGFFYVFVGGLALGNNCTAHTLTQTNPEPRTHINRHCADIPAALTDCSVLRLLLCVVCRVRVGGDHRGVRGRLLVLRHRVLLVA